MKEYVSKVKMLDFAQVSQIKKYTFHSKTNFFSYVAKIKMFLLSALLNMSEGEIILYKTNRQVAFRSFLDTFILKGFLKSCGEGFVFTDYPKLSIVGVIYCLDKRLVDQTLRAWGYVFPFEDREIAYAKALGESIERHATCYLEGSKEHFYPTVHYGDASFLYEYMPKFTSEQINSNTRLVSSPEDLLHVKGFSSISVTGGSKHFIPLFCMYWGDTKVESNKIIFHDTTSGSGGGVTYEQAFLSAVYETIERDHFLLYWFSGIHPNIISNESITGVFGDYVRNMSAEYNLEVYFLDTRYDIDVKTCVCVVVDPVLNLISMGGKASSSSVEALKSSLLEALAVMTTNRERGNATSEKVLTEVLAIKTFVKNINRLDRMDLYCSSLGISMIKKYFLSGPEIQFEDFEFNEQKFDSFEQEKNFIISSFKGLVSQKGDGYHVYENRARSVWAKDAMYEVCHIFVPSFLKLHLDEMLATPVSDRLYSFARKNGKSLFHENDIVKLPHFFP